MNEQERIANLFEKLYQDSPWIDVNLVSTLDGITAKQAYKRVLPNCNTIWEITQHMIAWRNNVLKRVKGKTIQTPANNYVEKVKDHSAKAWKATVQKLAGSQKKWMHFLHTTNPGSFEKIYPVNGMTYYEHIQGILQHDAYHLGQLVLLKKLLLLEK